MSLIERVMESETLSEKTKQRFMDGWILGRVRAEERERITNLWPDPRAGKRLWSPDRGDQPVEPSEGQKPE